MSHLKDKNATVTVVFLLRNTLRSQQITVKQEPEKTMALYSLCFYMYVLPVHTSTYVYYSW